MSFQAMAWGVKQETNNPISKLLLLMICNYADEKGRAYPSQEHLAKLCQCSRMSIVRHIKELEKDKFITISKERNGAFGYNLYTLNMNYVTESYKANVTESYIASNRELHNTQDIHKNIYSSKFEDFWDKVPRKIGKKKAKSIYERLVKSNEVSEDVLIDAMDNYSKSVKNTDTKFIAHPSSWLNAGRWSDEIEINDNKEKFKENWLM